MYKTQGPDIIHKMEWVKADDIRMAIKEIIERLELSYADPRRIVCFRSFGSSSRARARIWGFPKVWQLALGRKPHYVIEVLSEHFDRLSTGDKTRVLIHELLHIPKNFSGSLVPHKTRFCRIDGRRVEGLFQQYQRGKL